MTQAEKNKKKYRVPPTIQQLNDYIKWLGMTAPHFELYFSIPSGTIKCIRQHKRDLPKKYWHLVFEKKKANREPYHKRKLVPNKETKKETNNTTSKSNTGVLNKLKDTIG